MLSKIGVHERERKKNLFKQQVQCFGLKFVYCHLQGCGQYQLEVDVYRGREHVCEMQECDVTGINSVCLLVNTGRHSSPKPCERVKFTAMVGHYKEFKFSECTIKD